ncbi:uncharacterized protein LOC131317087 [Rhododendron vialii]|uniref:uncharacterized protein LOC131317087 n=1 Tax=Rhododendron vialii TaxID=182163 RepID=UPI0026601F49|nr:uncharacterized protein LOC131317087 [Rhododendron vialii]
MEDPAVLLCRRADKSVAIILSQNLDFESLVSKLSHKWKDLTQGCFEISYTLDGHPNCDVGCDEDMIALRTSATKFRIGRIDVFVHDLSGSNTSLNVGECGDRFSSSLNVRGSSELISEIDNGSEMTLSLYDQERKQLKSDAWRIAIKGVDQVFVGGAVAFRNSLSKYSLFHGFQYIYAKNDAETVKARCRTLHCTWFVKAKVEKPSGLFRIKELMNEHSCGAASLSTSSSRSSSSLIGRIFSEDIRLSPSKRPVDVRKELKKDYGIDVTYRRAWMGVEKARSFVYGDYTKSFKELTWFVNSFKASNPDSACDLECDEAQRFKRLFVGFATCKHGFKFCLPLLFLDGTFLKGTHKGCLLAACAKDGNRGLYPICVAIVDSENSENWHWFMLKLRDFLDFDKEVVFISDRHEGLLRAVESVFPSSPHSYCLLHLKANLRKHMGGLDTKKKKHIVALFHRCACAAKVQECDKLLSWWRKRYGELTSNLVECFNNWIRKERRLPITQLVDKIRLKLMDQMCDRRELAAKWKTVICPKWDKKLVELFGLSKTWNVVRSNGDLYEVQSDPSVGVDIVRRSCSCGDWQLNMFPCVHGVCALKKSKKDLNDYMERCFFSESYREAYSKCINPVPRIWQNVDLDVANDILLPPLCKRPPGRPRTERIPSTGAKTKKVTCSRCGQVGYACFVPVLPLPMSGYVMKVVTIFNFRMAAADDSEAYSAMLDAFAEEQGFASAGYLVMEAQPNIWPPLCTNDVSATGRNAPL